MSMAGRVLSGFLAISSILIVLSGRAPGAITWLGTGADDSWSTVTNWNPNGSPDGQDIVFDATDARPTAGTVNSIVSSSLSVASLNYLNTTNQFHTTQIDANQTLTVNGNVTIGPDAAGTTNVAILGGGSLAVNSASGTFQVGGSNQTSGNSATLNMSGLTRFTADVGTFRVGDNTGNSGSTASTVILAKDSTIKATNLELGGVCGREAVHTLKLGSGANVINADNVYVGMSTGRSGGTLQFNGTGGSLNLHAKNGTGRANMYVAAGSSATWASQTSLVDFTGHQADLLLNRLDIASRAGGYDNTGNPGSGATATFSFDTGTLDVTAVTLANRSGAANTGTKPIVGTLNLGGGTVNIGSGGIALATNSSSSTGTVTGTVNITGGAVTLAGNIAKGGGTGTTASLTLNGPSAVLNMQGRNITGLDTFTYQDGTLKNLGTVNTGITLAGTGSRVFQQDASYSGEVKGIISGAGIGLIKTGAGKLALSGSNSYTGNNDINDGVLQFNAPAAIGGGTARNVTVNSGATVAFGPAYGTLQSTLASRIANTSAGTIALTADSSEALDFSSAGADLTAASLGAVGTAIYSGVLTPNGTTYRLGGGGGTLTVSSNLTGNNSLVVHGAGSSGTVVLSGTNNYTGTTTVNPGVLSISSESRLGSGTVTLAGGTLRTTGDDKDGLTITKSINLTGNSFLDTLNTGNTIYRGVISDGDGVFGFTKVGGYNLVLQANNTYRGETVLNTATTYLRTNNGLGSVAGATTLANTGTLSVETDYTTPETLYLNGGILRTSSEGGTRSWWGNIVLGATSTIQAKNQTSAATLVINGTISGDYGLLVGSGEAGIVQFGGANTYSGDTRIVKGTLRLTSTNALQNTTLNLASGDTGVLTFSTTPTAYTVGGLKGSRNLDLDGKTVSIGNNGQSTTYSGQLSNGSLTKVGGGTLTLSNASLHAGDTRIASGTLTLENANALQNSTLDLAAGDVGELAFGSATTYVLGGLKGARDFDMRGNALSIGNNNLNTTYDGQLSNGSLTKVGTGALRLTGVNSQTSTAINAGTLEFSADANLGQSGAGITLAGGTLRYIGTKDGLSVDRAITLTADSSVSATDVSVSLAGKISDGSGTFGLTCSGGRVCLANGANDYDGVTVVTSTGKLYATRDHSLGNPTGATIVESGGQFMVETNYTTRETLRLNGGILRTSAGGGSTVRWAGDVVLGADSIIRAKVSGGQSTLVVAGTISGDHGLRVGDGEAGIVKFTGTNTYTGATSVLQGNLVVDGSIAASSGVSVASGATLQGHGCVSSLSGAGLISPGNSPGVLTATSVDPAGGLDFAFQFNAPGSPDYDNAAASVNDVLRLASLSAPFAGPLESGNQINVYLNVASLDADDLFRGGFFTDRTQDFSPVLAQATFNYFVALDGQGTYTFEGVNYYRLADTGLAPGFAVTTVLETADFGAGPVQGYVLQFGQLAAVPEPSTAVLAAGALLCLGLVVRRRRG
jgi:autotransporter-associated beta strand protein